MKYLIPVWLAIIAIITAWFPQLSAAETVDMVPSQQTYPAQCITGSCPPGQAIIPMGRYAGEHAAYRIIGRGAAG